MNADDFHITLEAVATACRPLKAEVERLEEENREIRTRLFELERRVNGNPANYRHDPQETVALPKDWRTQSS